MKFNFWFLRFCHSQAAILQQTAQYIITLEREKTTLLNQVCHLKRVVDQHDGAVVEVVQSSAAQQQQTGATTQAPNLKKRKLDTIYTMQTISDSSDEGLGSMSPEPTVLTNVSSAIATKQNSAPGNGKEFIDLKNMLENERRKNLALEERLRQFVEKPIYTSSSNENGTVTYQHELIEHTDNLCPDDDENSVRTIVIGDSKLHHGTQNVQVLALDTLPHAGQTRVVMCSQIDDEVDMLDGMHHAEAYDEDDSRTMSPYMETATTLVKEELIINDHRSQSPNICVVESIRSSSSPDNSHLMQTSTATNSNIRLQPILEAVIKADPKVEVERINSPSSITVIKDGGAEAIAPTTQTNPNANRSSRMYVTHNTSRQNLETIVEAIRHLEGDQLFGEMIEPTQEVPLALTNKPQRQLRMEMDSFLHFRPTSAATHQPSSQIPQHQQQQQQHSPLLQAQLQHTKCANATVRAAAVPVAKSSPATTIIMHSQHLQQNHSINNRPGVIVVKQNS